MSLSPGTRIGAYEVVGAIGAGGMGEVYRARDAKLNRDVALKLLPAALASDPERVARFRREAQLLAALNHPNIGQIYGFEDPSAGSQGAGHALVLELVEGPTLADLIADHPRGLPMNEALAIARQIAEALDAAHEHGITHRDLKPANIKVREDGAVKVLDFGLAKALDPTASSASADPSNSPTFTAHATQMGVIVGTAAYMSPEQARGKVVDRRADIWAFGAVVFEMLTGRRPFEGETVSDMIAKILEREPDWSLLPAATPPRVRELLERCLEKDVKQRQRDIGDVRIQLRDRRPDSSSSMSASGVGATSNVPAARAGMSWLFKGAALFVAGAAAGIAVWAALKGTAAGATGGGSSAHVSITMPRDVRALQAHVTPDGRALVVLGVHRNADGSEEPRSRIYVRNLDEFSLKPLAGTEGSSNYALSPDGKSIAFIAELSEQSSQRQISRAPLDGSAPPVKLADWEDTWETNFEWLDDDDLLIVTANGAKMFRLPTGGGPRKPPMPIDTGGVTGTPEPHGHLPGDAGVFFGMESWGARGYQLDSWLLDPKTGKATRLFESASPVTYVPGGQIVFARGETVMTAAFDLRTLAVTGPVTSLFGGVRTPQSWAHGDISLSRDGTLAFAPGGRLGTDRRLVAVDSSGKVTPFGGDLRSYESSFTASRDGKQVAVVVPNAQGTYETWVADEGRPSLRRVLALPNADCAGSVWSPDGHYLAYTRTARDANDGVYIQSVDGAGQARLVVKNDSRNERFYAVSWAPDNSALIVNRTKDGTSDIMIVPLPLTNPPAPPRPLLATPAGEGGGVFSRDGKWIAYMSDESGRREVYVASYSGGTLGSRTMVSSGGGAGTSWSGDGRRLFYQASSDRLMSVTINTSKGISASTPVLVHDMKALRLREWDVLADGRLLAVQNGAGEDDITQFNLITNWKPNARPSAQTP